MPEPKKPNRGAQLFKRYLEENQISQSVAGRKFGVAKSYIGILVNMRATPGAATMKRIEELTDGAVPMAAWFEDPEDDPAPKPADPIEARAVIP